MIADISHGHITLADWLFLIAAVVFALAAILSGYVTAARPSWLNTTTLVAVGLALLAVAWLVL